MWPSIVFNTQYCTIPWTREPGTYFPPPGRHCRDWCFVGREPSRLDNIAGTWKLLYIPAFKHIYIIISRNMQYLRVKFIQAIYFWKKYLKQALVIKDWPVFSTIIQLIVNKCPFTLRQQCTMVDTFIMICIILLTRAVPLSYTTL